MHRFLPLFLVGCAASSTPAASPAASKPPPPSELAAGRITLTPRAEERLGIPEALGTVELRSSASHTVLPGEVVPVAGRSVFLSAPITAEVGTSVVQPGTRVKTGNVLCVLTPLLGTTERVQMSTAHTDAQSQVVQAQVAVDGAELVLERAKKLVGDGLAGARTLEEAQAARNAVQATLDAAQHRLETLGGSGGQALASLPLRAPFAGVVRDVRVAPGQKVSAGSVVLEVVQEDPRWVRIAVPASMQARLSGVTIAWVQALGNQDGAWLELPIARSAPPTQLGAGVMALHVVLSGQHPFQLGQRVAVRIPDGAAVQRKTVPVEALVHGLSGDVWVYENVAPRVFERRRVEVERQEGGVAVLARADALAVGAHVATQGAMELLGIEFGAGK